MYRLLLARETLQKYHFEFKEIACEELRKVISEQNLQK